MFLEKSKKCTNFKKNGEHYESNSVARKRETQILKERPVSPEQIDSVPCGTSGGADASFASEIIETYIARSFGKKPSVYLKQTPEKSLLPLNKSIQPEKLHKYICPQKNSTITDIKEESLVSVDPDISRISFNKKAEEIIDTLQASPLLKIDFDEPNQEALLTQSFQTLPQNTGDKNLNPEVEVIALDSSSDQEILGSQHKNGKKQKVSEVLLISEDDFSQQDSARISPLIERKKRSETIIGKKTTRFPWHPEELAALEEGMSLHGTKSSKILADHGPTGRNDRRLANRSQIQLKDIARTEREARERTGRPLGVFRIACNHA